jgi:hypothetical protein
MSLRTFSTDFLTKLKLLIGLTSIQDDLAVFGLSANGYQKLPNGLILQWGSTTTFGGGGDWVSTFPIPFTVACHVAFANVMLDNNTAVVESKTVTGLNGSSLNAATNTNTVNGATVLWFAIGY